MPRVPPAPSCRRRFLCRGVAAASAVTAAAWTAPAAEPPAPVIDTHTHFYDPTRPGGVPWPPRDDAILYRTVLPAEWERLAQPAGVTGTVVVEASPLLEDNDWLLDLAERHAARRLPGMLGIVGVVGNLPLGDPACAAALDRCAARRLYRGIRVNGDALLACLDDPASVADLARLADRDLTLDVNGGRVLAAAAAAAARFPRLRIVVDHLGTPVMSARGPQAAWRDAVARAADHPRVFMKVSALAENAARTLQPPRAPGDPSFYEPWLDAAWASFGDRRLMYGSNWPVADRAATYADVLGIVRPFVDRRGPEASRWFFAEAARAAYSWVEPAA